MDPEKIQVNITPRVETQTILFGRASEPLPNPVAVKIGGNIDAPARFVEKRGKLIKADTAHVTVHRENPMYIALHIDETNPIYTEITGELSLDPDLLQFHVNANHLYTVKDLAALLRMRRIFFRDPDQHEKIMKNLAEFSVRTAVEFTEKDDRKGNAELLRKRASTVDLDFEFVLQIPIYKGFGVKTFRVEILADVTDVGVKLWLESVELAELLTKERDLIFAVQLDALKDFVIIEQ